ncbi:MAG TPA: exosortase/archaeosortase family protein [Opitutus sp.]|nr:exosortase/archaeosortase family protein [Opitutus sp.]
MPDAAPAPLSPSSSPATRSGARLVVPVGAAVLALCWLLPVTVSWRTAPDLGHAWAVPLLMAYLWWERWGERPPLAVRNRLPLACWLLMLGLAIIDLPLRLLLTPYPLWPMLLLGHALVFAGIALLAAWLLAGRPGVGWIGGPLILLVSTLPVPSYLENAVIVPLREIFARLAAEISNLLGQPALAFGTSVHLGNGWVGIDEACGGIRSLQACVMIGLFFGEWYRFRFTRRVALLFAAVAAALLGNFARVLFLSLRASAGARAVESAHDLAGWLAMGASLLLTGWLACRWAGYRFPEWGRGGRIATSGASRKFPAAALWLAGIAGCFALNDAGTRLWFAHGREIRHATIPQWTAALPEHHWSFQPSPLSQPAREMLRPDFFVAGSWRTDADTTVSAYYVQWTHGQVARSVPFLHNPTICLPYAGCELVSTLRPLEVSWAGGTLPFFAYKFRQMGREILVAFTIWDPARGRLLQKPSPFQSWTDWWNAQWTEVREARQNQPGQLLTVSLPWSEDSPHRAQLLLQKIIRPAPESL